MTSLKVQKASEHSDSDSDSVFASRTSDVTRQAQKMITVGLLTREVAHEFNNQLQGILGAVQLIQKMVETGRAAEILPLATSAMSSVQHAAKLTRGLLEFSRPHSFEAEVIRLNELVVKLENILRHTQPAHINIELRLAQNPLQTKCDYDDLENAVLGMVLNARESIPQSGTIVIETSDASPSSSTSTASPISVQHVCISVTALMNEAEDEKKSVDDSQNSSDRKPHLGLSIARDFAVRAGGSIELIEASNRSSATLYLTLHNEG